MEVQHQPAAPTARPGLAWRRRLRTLVGWSAWSYAGLLLIAWVFLWTESDRWWPATLLLFGPRWALGLPLLVLIPLAAWVRRRYLILLVVLLLFEAGPIMGFCLPWQTFVSAGPARPPLRILTCNIHRNQLDADPLGSLIAETMPDVVVFQDWSGRQEQAIFWQREWHLRRDEDELFVASRYPIRRAHSLAEAFPEGRGAAVQYELETPDGTLNFFNVHLASPHRAFDAVLDERWAGIPELERNIEDRRIGSEGLSRYVKQITGPVLLAGDFNTPTGSTIYRRYWSSYQNAFSVAGWGWGHTYFTRRQGFRIDHLLAGPGWRCHRCWVGPDVGSPHRPVIADLEWVGAGSG